MLRASLGPQSLPALHGRDLFDFRPYINLEG